VQIRARSFLFTAAKKNCPIFSLYSSEEKLASAIIAETIKGKPFIDASNGDGFIHRLWRISDSASIKTIKEEMSDRDVFIADGHHRYETALSFKKEMEEKGMNKTGNEPFNYVLMFLSNMEDEGLTLLPTHRIVELGSDFSTKETLRKHFDVEKISAGEISEKEAKELMFEKMGGSGHTFGMFLTNADAYYTISFNGSDIDVDLPDCLKNLDVSVLHKYVFEKLLNVDHYEYEMDPDIAVERAKKDSFEAVFFLNSTRIHELKDVALAGHRMPPKSTYFYPKLLTGMVIYKF
jgi:uncharacterized protein (DUF1015 family)